MVETQTNVAGIMDYLNDTLRKLALKETEWLVQKSNYEGRITDLEAQVKAHENINIDLIRRIKMLEYALSQERTKNSKASGNNIEAKPISLFDAEDKRDLLKEEDLKKLKEKSVRPSLIKMLNELGINENFANELFNDLEINKPDLDRMIKNNIDEKYSNTNLG
jgi:striatin 1/3/4